MKRKKSAKRNSAAALLGAKGGKAGTGEAKARGSSEYYRQLVARRKDRINKEEEE